MSKIDKIIIHHTAVSREFQPDQFDAVNEYHRRLWNFKSSLNLYGGYNYIISASGKIKQYRIDGEETAAVKGQNLNNIQIALCGNFDIERPTEFQIASLKNLILEKMTKYVILPNNIFGHRMWQNKSCPGRLWKESELKALFQPDRSYYMILLEKLKEQLLSMKTLLGQSNNNCISKESRD